MRSDGELNRLEVVAQHAAQEINGLLAKKDQKGAEQARKQLDDEIYKYCSKITLMAREHQLNEIDVATLLYREIKAIRNFAKKLRKKKVKMEAPLKKNLAIEANNCKRKAEGLELIAKYVKRGGLSNVAVSEASVLGDDGLLALIKAKAIEIATLHNKMKDPKQFLTYFKREIDDIYSLGKSEGTLIKRLEDSFNNISRHLLSAGIRSDEIEKTKRMINRRVSRIEVMYKRLHNSTKKKVEQLAA